MLWLGVQTPGASRCPKHGRPGSSEGMARELTAALLYNARTLSSYPRPGHEATRSWGLQSRDFWSRGYAVGWTVSPFSVCPPPLGPGFPLAQHLRVAWAVSHWAAGGHTGGVSVAMPLSQSALGLFLPSWLGPKHQPPSQAQATLGPAPWEAVTTLRRGHPK